MIVLTELSNSSNLKWRKNLGFLQYTLRFSILEIIAIRVPLRVGKKPKQHHNTDRLLPSFVLLIGVLFIVILLFMRLYTYFFFRRSKIFSSAIPTTLNGIYYHYERFSKLNSIIVR